MKTLKVLAACGNGMGSSQIIKMRIEQVLRELGLQFKCDHASVGQAKSDARSYDLVLVSQQLVKEFQNVPETTKVVGLLNLLSLDEIREKVTKALDL